MLRKLVCSVAAAVLIGALLAVVPVAAPTAHAAELPPVFSLKWGSLGVGNGQFKNPMAVAADAAGYVYVADYTNHRVQKFTSSGTFVTTWGSYGNADGQFTYPAGVAVDAAGYVYVTDNGNHRVQKFTSAGVFVAKWGTYGTGNGQFNGPFGVAVDAAGYVYVVDAVNNRVQKFTSAGVFVTKWGTLGAGDGQFNYPRGVAVDAAGYVYVTEQDNDRVQKFTSAGVFVTKWGTSGTGDGQFNNPFGVAVDASGYVYVGGDDNRVQKFTSAGVFVTKWGGYGTGDGQFSSLRGLATDAVGSVYVADTANQRIQKFVPAAPSLTISKTADEGTVVAGATIHYHVTVTNTGNVPLTGVTVTDAKAPACAGALADIAVGGNRVVDCTYTTTGSDIGLYANTATVDTNETDAVTSTAVTVNVTAAAQSEDPPQFVRPWGPIGTGAGQFNLPWGVAVDSSGNVYVVDVSNHRVQKFSADGAFVTQWGSNGTGDGQFNGPVDVAVDGAGYVYVTDSANQRVQKFTSSGTFVTKWGTWGNGNGQFNFPYGVAVDSSGNVYVADTYNNRVQKFTSTGTYLGQWGSLGTANGQFNNPMGVAVDAAGNVYVADYSNDRVQKFTSTGGYLAKWGNTGTADGQFNRPRGVAVDADGDVYVTDYANTRVQKFTSTGTFVTKWGTAGVAHGQFSASNGASGIAADGSGRVWVVDRSNHRVQQFAPPPTPSEAAPVFVRTWGSLGSGDGQFSAPDAVGVSPATGDVYVADRGNHRVQQFTREGVFVRTWGSNGTGNGQFREPTGVAVAGSGDVYVSDKLNHRVQQFTATGTWVRNIGVGTLSNPEGVAVDPSGNVYVADSGHQRVQKFTATGTLVATIGTSGSANGQLSYAQGVAATDTAVYVSDTYNRRVQQFTPTGTYVRGWGVQGSGNGQVQETDGLAVGPAGRVVVADPNNTRLQAFTGTGTFVTTWGTAGTGDGQFVAPSPADVAVTADGWVYAVDRANHRIEQFAPSAIRGTVTEQGTGTPLAGTWVVALRAADYALVEGSTTADDGSYTLPLAAGGYHLEFIDPHLSHDVEWYDDHAYAGLAGSDVVTATLGASTSPVDAALNDPTGAVAGTVTATPEGTPIAGTVVAVLPAGVPRPVAATRTGTDGRYRIAGLRPGDYIVVSAQPMGTRHATFYGDTPDIDASPPVTVTAGATTTATDLAMPPVTGDPVVGTLTGTITDDVTGQPEPDVFVGALRAADHRFTVATFTDNDGHYSLGVGTGDYYVDLYDLDTGHQFEWYDDQLTPDSFDQLTTLAAPATADAGLVPLEGTLAGTVTEDGTGSPLGGVWVALIGYTTGQPVAGTTTATDGAYQLPAIDIGDYYLVFIDPTGNHALEFHDGTGDMGHATPVTVTGGHTTLRDAALAPD